jgi:crossover junction endodeoxyribonuclease RuvC
MRYIYIGLDPGSTGAMAAVNNEGELLEWGRFPLVKVGNKKVLDIQGISVWIEERGINMGVRVTVEKVHAMPGQGVTSMFSFGRSFGILEGIVISQNLPIQYAAPQAWQKVMLAGKPRGKGATKTSAVAAACELWPQLHKTLKVKAAWGVADAALIAEYGRRMWA